MLFCPEVWRSLVARTDRVPENRSERSERDFWDKEERSAHASIAPQGDAREQPTAMTRDQEVVERPLYSL